MAAITPFAGTLPSKAQPPVEFNANVTAFLAYIATLGPEINTAISEILVGANVAVWSAGVYNPPTIVAGSDGIRYACVATTVAGDNPVGSVTGKWVALIFDSASLFPTVSAAVRKTGDIRGNDATVSGNVITFSPGSCKDSTDSVTLYSAVDQTVTIPSTANTLYYIFKVRLSADGSCVHRAYTTYAGADSDAEVSHYRWIDYWRTGGDGVCLDGFSSNGIHYNTKASECAISSKTSPPANCSTAVSLLTFVPSYPLTKRVLIGGQSATIGCIIVLGFDGTNSFGSFKAMNTNNGDTDYWAWGAQVDGPDFMPLKGDSIYWGDGGYTNTGTVDLRLHAVELNR